MKNKWEERLSALADDYTVAGMPIAGDALRRWSNGEGAHAVNDVKSFASVLAHVGLGLHMMAENIEKALTAPQEPPSSPFFMVFREGGRSPTFKHPDVVSASKEAARICRESGEATHVLGVVETHRPNRRPTEEQLIEHAEKHPYGNNPNFGLWRIVETGKVPAIVAIRSAAGVTPYVAYDSNFMPGAHYLSLPEAKWFPVDAEGKDLRDDDIPF